LFSFIWFELLLWVRLDLLVLPVPHFDSFFC
jgi:hypothetical protein